MYDLQAVYSHLLSLYHLLKIWPHYPSHFEFQILLVKRIKKFPISVDFAIQHHFASKLCDRLFESIIHPGTIYIYTAVSALPWPQVQTLKNFHFRV